MAFIWSICLYHYKAIQTIDTSNFKILLTLIALTSGNIRKVYSKLLLTSVLNRGITRLFVN